MFNFLNNLSWLVSILFGAMVFYIFSGGEIGGGIIGGFVGIIIKGLFFSEDNLLKGLKGYENKIIEDLKSEFLDQNVKIKKDEIIKEKVEEKETLQENLNLSVKNVASKVETNIVTEKVDELKEKVIEKVEEIKQDVKQNDIIGNNLYKFFTENLLAKFGAIMIFLAVFILLVFLWNLISDWTKIIIGFIIGFVTYFIGVWLDRKNLIGESRVLMGIGISINFLVILAGKYIFDLIEDTNTSALVTFVALFLNTVLGVFSGLKYKNKTFLIFSFFVGYVIPWLLGLTYQEPYLLLIYSFFVTVSAIVIGEKVDSRSLIILSFVLGNLYFIGAPSSTEIGFLTKFSFTIIASFLFINVKTTKNIIGEDSFFTNSLILSPIVIQALFKNCIVSDFGYLILSLYAIIIFGYLFYKTREENKFLLLGNLLVIFMFLFVNIGYEINIYTFVVSILLLGANFVSLFVYPNLKEEKNLSLLSSTFLASSFFAIFSGFYLWEIQDVGVLFLIFAFIFLIFGFIYTKIASIKDYVESNFKGLFLMFFSFFTFFLSVGVILIFQDLNILYKAMFLFIQSTLILALFKVTKDEKFRIISNLVSIFGILVTFYSLVNGHGNNVYLIFSIFLFLNMLLQAYLIKREIKVQDIFLHIVGLVFSFLAIDKYLGIQHYNLEKYYYLYLMISTFVVVILAIFYKFIENNVLKKFFIVLFVISCFSYVGVFYDVYFDQLPAAEEYNFVLLSIFGLLVFFGVSYFYQVKKDENTSIINIIYYLFAFVLLSLIAYEITQTIHSFTALWGVIGSALMIYGINFKKAKFRTIGLYLILIVFIKIIFDLLVGQLTLNPLVGVFIIGILGIILVAISIFYTKIVGVDIKQDFNIKNIYDNEKN